MSNHLINSEQIEALLKLIHIAHHPNLPYGNVTEAVQMLQQLPEIPSRPSVGEGETK
jgi:hypothetical protein